MAALILLTTRRFAGRTAVTLLAGCALLQVYDQHVLPRIGSAPPPAFAQPTSIAQWVSLARAFPRVEIQPAFDATVGVQFNAFIQYIAARANLPINSVYNARPLADNDAEFIAADHPVILPGPLYLSQKSDYSFARLTQLLDGQQYLLAEAEDCYVAAAAWPSGFLAQNAALLRPPPAAPLLALSPKTLVDFTGNGNLTGVSFTGLYNTEFWGRWSRGADADFRTGLDPALQGHALVLRGQFIPYLDAAHPHLVVDVTVNGQPAATWTFAPPEGQNGPVARTATVPASATTTGTLDWHFHIHDPVNVLLSYGPRRNLGLGFVRFTVADGGK